MTDLDGANAKVSVLATVLQIIGFAPVVNGGVTMTLDPLRDPLKGNAVVPQKYVDALERQGWVKVVRCRNCRYYTSFSYYTGRCERRYQTVDGDWFCADGERADAPTCGPDYCEIGGE